MSSAANSRSRIRCRAAARSASDTVTAASGSSVGERIDERAGTGIRGAFELQPQGDRHDAGLERKLRAGERPPADPGSGASATMAPMWRAGIGGIENRLDANQLQALACSARGTAKPVRSGDRRERLRSVRSTRPARSCRRRSASATSGASAAAITCSKSRRRRRWIALVGAAATLRRRAAPRAPPHRGGWSARRIHPPPRPSAGARESRGRRPAACARSPPPAMAIAAAATRPPAASRTTARVTKGGKGIRPVIVECELC